MDILKARKKAKEIKKKKQDYEKKSAEKKQKNSFNAEQAENIPADDSSEILPGLISAEGAETGSADDVTPANLQTGAEEQEYRKIVLEELEKENRLIIQRAQEFAEKTEKNIEKNEIKIEKDDLPAIKGIKPDGLEKSREKDEEIEAEDIFDEVIDDLEEQPKAERAGDTVKFLVFRIGKEFYSIDIMKIKKIDPIDEITRVPNTPAFVSGVISLRGEIIPVFDLKKKMNIHDYKGIKKPTIIILKEQNAGIIIDYVVGVQEIEISGIEKAVNIVGSIDSEFITGIVRNKGVVFSVLDITGLIRKEILEDINNYFSGLRF